MSERERIPDRELDEMLVDNQKNGDAYMTAREARLLIAELRERRAQDLSAAEVDLLAHVRRVYPNATGMHHDEANAAMAVLDKLLAARKGGE